MSTTSTAFASSSSSSSLPPLTSAPSLLSSSSSSSSASLLTSTGFRKHPASTEERALLVKRFSPIFSLADSKIINAIVDHFPIVDTLQLGGQTSISRALITELQKQNVGALLVNSFQFSFFISSPYGCQADSGIHPAIIVFTHTYHNRLTHAKDHSASPFVPLKQYRNDLSLGDPFGTGTIGYNKLETPKIGYVIGAHGTTTILGRLFGSIDTHPPYAIRKPETGLRNFIEGKCTPGDAVSILTDYNFGSGLATTGNHHHEEYILDLMQGKSCGIVNRYCQTVTNKATPTGESVVSMTSTSLLRLV